MSRSVKGFFGSIGVIAFFTLIFAFAPHPLFAAGNILTDPLGICDNGTCTGNVAAIIIGRIIRALLSVAGVATLAMFIYGGVQMLISQGDKKRYQAGLTTLTWAIIGIVVVFGSYAIIDFLFRTMLGV